MSKEFSYFVYEASEYLWKNRKNNDTGLFLLASVDKVTKEKNELRDNISQLQKCINNLNVFEQGLEENLSSINRAQIAEKNNKQALII